MAFAHLFGCFLEQHAVTAGDGGSNLPAISDDGRLVAFYSYAANLTSDDTDGYVDVFVRVAPTGTVPSAQGKAVAQSPLLLVKTRPVGVASATITFTVFVIRRHWSATASSVFASGGR